MTPSDPSKEVLNQLLERAAVERDRAKFLELLRQINRLRAERWLMRASSEVPSGPRPSLESDRFDIFSGPPDKDAAWLEAVVGIDRARERISEIAASAPGEYFIFHARSHGILGHLHGTPAVISPLRKGAA
jgi:hypothetical protein